MVNWGILTLPSATWTAAIWIRAGFRLVLRVQTELSLTVYFSRSVFKLAADSAAPERSSEHSSGKKL